MEREKTLDQVNPLCLLSLWIALTSPACPPPPSFLFWTDACYGVIVLGEWKRCSKCIRRNLARKEDGGFLEGKNICIYFVVIVGAVIVSNHLLSPTHSILHKSFMHTSRCELDWLRISIKTKTRSNFSLFSNQISAFPCWLYLSWLLFTVQAEV